VKALTDTFTFDRLLIIPVHYFEMVFLKVNLGVWFLETDLQALKVTQIYFKWNVKSSILLTLNAEEVSARGCVETLYWFGDNNHREWSEMFDAYVQPRLSLPGLTPAYSYGVAGQ